jgi:hypothetical protein
MATVQCDLRWKSRVFKKKELHSGIPNVAAWSVLQKILHLKKYLQAVKKTSPN